MKKFLITIIVSFTLLSCDKDSLLLVNPNEPGLEALKTDIGMQKAALGIYQPMHHNYFVWFAYTDHNIMGDMTMTYAGNFGWRSANQPTSVTLSNGTILGVPAGDVPQIEGLAINNTRAKGTDNTQNHEWLPMYGIISHANLLLSLVDESDFTGTSSEVEMKKKTYKAWHLWWKGFAYSRLGSIYSKALIVNESGDLSNDYLSQNLIIDEATKNFNEAIAILGTIPEDNNTYNTIIVGSIPSQFQSSTGGLLSPKMFIRNIKSYKARNILVNKYAKDLTTSDLSEIKTLTTEGIQNTDKIFNVRSSSNNCFVLQTAWSPFRLLAGWEFLSERLVQDFKPGDDRFSRNIVVRSSPMFNPSGRGHMFGTRYTLASIENGGDYVSQKDGEAEIPLAVCYEENMLMLAEAEIRGGNIDAGLAYIDDVREHQNAKLAPTKGTGLTKEQALEELRRERRIGLFLKNTAFYDARRWGLFIPVAQGGGRKNAVIVIDATGKVDDGATIDYQYKEWWDVPANETDYNPVN